MSVCTRDPNTKTGAVHGKALGASGRLRPSHLLGHAEVDERGLRSDLRLVVRVGQLGLQVQPELAVVLHLRTRTHTHSAGRHGQLLLGGAGELPVSPVALKAYAHQEGQFPLPLAHPLLGVWLPSCLRTLHSTSCAHTRARALHAAHHFMCACKSTTRTRANRCGHGTGDE